MLYYMVLPALVILSVIIISSPIETQAVNEKVLLDYNPNSASLIGFFDVPVSMQRAEVYQQVMKSR